MHDASDSIPAETLRTILASQYHAALAMLREAIAACPEDLWYDETPTNAFWQVAYHTLYFTHLYLQPHQAAFRPWSGHQVDVQHPDGIAGPPEPGSDLPLLPEPYTKQQALEYWEYCAACIDEALATMDLSSPESGFRWYRVSKLEHQMVNIRHVQHHAAQLADRLRARKGVGVRWTGARPRPVRRGKG